MAHLKYKSIAGLISWNLSYRITLAKCFFLGQFREEAFITFIREGIVLHFKVTCGEIKLMAICKNY